MGSTLSSLAPQSRDEDSDSVYDLPLNVAQQKDIHANRLLSKPRPLPTFKDEENGVYAQWGIKGFYFHKKSMPKFGFKGRARVQYSHLVVQGCFPDFTVKIPLIQIGYVESEGDILDVRGCDFKLIIVGIDGIDTIRDWLRFLIIRQRVPHSLLGHKFEWQTRPIRDDTQLKVSKISPLHCFRMW